MPVGARQHRPERASRPQGRRLPHLEQLGPGCLVGARYRLLGRARAGSKVWFALDPDGRRFAVKVGSRQETELEFRRLSPLEHPHIVQIIERVDEAAASMLVFEHLSGGDLVSLAGFHHDFWLRTFAELVNATHYLHACGMVHRDIKARNVMLDGSGRARLIDFGSARPIGSRWSPGGTTAAVVDPGRGDRPVAEADDLFALARLLEELMAGQLQPVTARTRRFQAALASAPARPGAGNSGDPEVQSAVIKSLVLSSSTNDE